MLNFLTDKLKFDILKCFSTVYEVRIRLDKPIIVKGNDGISVFVKSINYSLDKKELEQTIMRLCNHSLFSVEQSLRKGFITSNEGERVGVCGEVVYNLDGVLSIKNFTSLIIRLPNCVNGCSSAFLNSLDNAVSCLVISPPFHGKTTFIRDLGKGYSNVFGLNVLYVDERDELSGGGTFNLGTYSDVIRFSNKDFGFLNGVRAYNPDVIVSDEIMNSSDCESIEFARNSGVIVIASAHADNLKNLLKKQNLSTIIKKNTFDKIVLLNKFKIQEIYEEKDWQNIC